jgi:hypothetical protein
VSVLLELWQRGGVRRDRAKMRRKRSLRVLRKVAGRGSAHCWSANTSGRSGSTAGVHVAAVEDAMIGRWSGVYEAESADAGG